MCVFIKNKCGCW